MQQGHGWCSPGLGRPKAGNPRTHACEEDPCSLTWRGLSSLVPRASFFVSCVKQFPVRIYGVVEDQTWSIRPRGFGLGFNESICWTQPVSGKQLRPLASGNPAYVLMQSRSRHHLPPWFCHHVVISIPDDHDLGVENAIKIILGPPLEHGDFPLASRGYPSNYFMWNFCRRHKQ